MIVNRAKCKLTALEPVELVLCILYAIGIRSWFPVCMPMESGYMACHWAGETLFAMAVLATVLVALKAVFPSLMAKAGLDVALCGTALLMLRIPGGIISICSADGMRCGTTHGWTMAFGIALMLLALCDFALCLAKETAAKHQRGSAA